MRLGAWGVAIGVALMAAWAPATQAADLHQVGTWGASPLPDRTALTFSNQTFRNVVHTSVGGQNLRIRLSNATGRSNVTFTHVYVGVQSSGASIVPGTNRELTFNGSQAVTLYTGTEAYSDPLPGTIAPGQNLVISMYLPGSSGTTSNHWRTEQTTYVSAKGDHAAEESADNYPAANNNTVWWYLDAVTVEVPQTVHTVVAYGDSITDGYLSTLDAQHRYPDFLAARLLGTSQPLGVLNEGIAGNNLITDLLTRLDRDVLSQPDVTTVIYLGGINDIGVDRTAPTLIAADQQIVARLHARGIRVIGATLTPFGGSSTYTAAREATRQALNTWIRTTPEFDGVVDFDAALRDPADPTKMRLELNSGDMLHPNDAGYKRMADTVDLQQLLPVGEQQPPIGATAVGTVSAVTPATLSLTLGGPATFGAFVPGVARDYTASTTASVTSTAGDAALTVSSGRLSNGPFTLTQPVVVTPEKTAWAGPVSNDVFAIGFTQSIGASEPLRSGAYAATVTFTLSSSNP